MKISENGKLFKHGNTAGGGRPPAPLMPENKWTP